MTDPNPREFKRVLVTGSAGFIGANLVHWLLRNRPDMHVVSLDALTYAGNLANLDDLRDNPRHRFVRGNICDAKLVDELLSDGIDAIINAAAHTHVDRSLEGADEFVATNVGGVHTLAQAVKTRPNIRLLQISTDEVYGSQSPGTSADESYPLGPNNPYSATKAGGDLLALSYQRSFDLDILITRCANNYGPYQYPEKVIPLFITNLFENKKVPLYGDGLNIREWIHVDDHSAAIAAVLERGRTGEVYNITSSESLTNLELTETIIAKVGRDKSSIEYVTDRPGHDRRYSLDDRKIRNELGWSPKHNFPEGLEATVEWYRTHESWWQAIKSGEYRNYYERQYGSRAKP